MILSSIAPIAPYKALIFDCDGTLADTLPVHFQTWSASLQALGADISSKDCRVRCTKHPTRLAIAFPCALVTHI